VSAGKAFVWIDRRLDLARSGPVFLRQPDIADLVVASLFHGAELRHYELGSFVVMANHVHVPGFTKPPAEVIEGRYRARSESTAGTHGRAVLATGVLRSLGLRRVGVEPDPGPTSKAIP
jgi:hypothetical protein